MALKKRGINQKCHYMTPGDFYDKLNKEFNFDFDPCPLYSNFNGLYVEWGRSNFINPPYNRKLKESFIIKAYEESLKGKLCVMLLPVSTSSKIFHEVILPNAEVRFIKGRITFIEVDKNLKPIKQVWHSLHDSMVVIFRPRK